MAVGRVTSGHRYPKLREYIRPHEAGTMIGGIRREAEVLLGDPRPVEMAPDPDATLAGDADYLVTGDKELPGLGRVGHARILEARAFLEEVLRLTL